MKSCQSSVEGRKVYDGEDRQISLSADRSSVRYYRSTGCLKKSFYTDDSISGGCGCGNAAADAGGGSEGGGERAESCYCSCNNSQYTDAVSSDDSDENLNRLEIRQKTLTQKKSKAEECRKSIISKLIEKMKEIFTRRTFQPPAPSWLFRPANVILTVNKNCVTASRPRGGVTGGSGYISAHHPDAICEVTELRDGWVKNNQTFNKNDYSSNLRDFQTNARSFRSRRHVCRTDQVKPTETWFHLQRNGHESPTENRDLQVNSDISKSSSTNLDLNTTYPIDNNPKKAVSIQCKPALGLCRCCHNISPRWPLCQYRNGCVETQADRLVGLIFHCVILSVAIMAVVLARWTTEVLKFFFYLALHSAVYKGRISVRTEYR
ncbi:hypothetical protein PoB_001165800 [Plakobranchus ocellatus]|uniref:Uncharacterized protein n=1 Tax=Plakobranchus ocellatus TaxID=259542 RepID=A0AAV3YS11_9GAST|nr:hypothetical protein PoB_001165800 [Plakobranchus ocellatus]